MPDISTVIFVAYTPLTLKFEKDFYIHELEQAGLKVEYWNLTSLFYDNLKLQGEFENEKVLNIKDYEQLEENIKKKKTFSVFIFNITYAARVYKLFRLFSKYNCFTGIFARGALPSRSVDYSVAKKLLFKFKAFRKSKYFTDTALNQLAITAKRLGIIKSYSLIFYAGSSGIATIGYGFKYGLSRSKLIPINSFDYDAYLLLRDESNIEIKERYCVFLDGYMPYHPDFKMMNLPQIDPETYYSSLNKFFTWVECTYKVKVIIAAHPKSNYDDKKSYDDRIIIKNKTAELVQHAEFILLHASTAISFAVLFKKPLVFINTNAIKEIYYYTHYLMIQYFSELLKAAYTNIDENYSTMKVLPVDENAYTFYKYKYLTNPPSENIPSSSIIINYIKNSKIIN